MKFTRIAICFAVALITAVASAQTDTIFTYQGELQENGSAANGSFNFEFKLTNETGVFDYGTVSLSNVQVVDGQFTVQLDFGANALGSDPRQVEPYRWLAITVNGNQLAPPQPLNRVPYAMQTRGMYVNDFGRIELWPNLHVDIWGESPTLRIRDVTDGFGHLAIKKTSSTQSQIQQITTGGPALLDIDPMPHNGSSEATLRLFRSTDTSGLKRVVFYRGNDTTQTSATIGLDGADSFFQIQGGNVGIGTAAPDHKFKLDVRGEDDDWAVAGTAGLVGVYGEAIVSDTGVGVAGDSAGPNGVGVFGRAYANGDINYGVLGKSLSTQGFDFFADGAGQDYGSSSSRRWKSNVSEIDQPLSKISQLRGVYFDWDAEHGGHHDVGMIAEEVGKVFPEIVQYEENGIDAHGMDYSKLAPLLVEAVKAIQVQYGSRLTAQAEQISDLKLENEVLRGRLDSLELLVEQTAPTQKGKNSK